MQKSKYTLTQMIDLLAGPEEVDAIDVIKTLGDINEEVGQLRLDNDRLRDICNAQERSNQAIRDKLKMALQEKNEFKSKAGRIFNAAQWMRKHIQILLNGGAFARPKEIIMWTKIQTLIDTWTKE